MKFMSEDITETRVVVIRVLASRQLSTHTQISVEEISHSSIARPTNEAAALHSSQRNTTNSAESNNINCTYYVHKKT